MASTITQGPPLPPRDASRPPIQNIQSNTPPAYIQPNNNERLSVPAYIQPQPTNNIPRESIVCFI